MRVGKFFCICGITRRGNSEGFGRLDDIGKREKGVNERRIKLAVMPFVNGSDGKMTLRICLDRHSGNARRALLARLRLYYRAFNRFVCAGVHDAPFHAGCMQTLVRIWDNASAESGGEKNERYSDVEIIPRCGAPLLRAFVSSCEIK